MGSDQRLTRVCERVARLSRSARRLEVLGFYGHEFEFKPPLPAAKVEELERTWRVRLPADYRYFLTHVGNGGAGPGYGLFPVGRWGDSAKENDPWDEWMVSDLEARFPLTEAWNLPEEALVPPDLDDARLETWFERRDATYFAPALINGTIPIAHLGCAIWLRLVVTGPLAGQVWTDDRASDNGLSPASPADFTDWYTAWLEESEATLYA